MLFERGLSNVGDSLSKVDRRMTEKVHVVWRRRVLSRVEGSPLNRVPFHTRDSFCERNDAIPPIGSNFSSNSDLEIVDDAPPLSSPEDSKKFVTSRRYAQFTQSSCNSKRTYLAVIEINDQVNERHQRIFSLFLEVRHGLDAALV